MLKMILANNVIFVTKEYYYKEYRDAKFIV